MKFLLKSALRSVERSPLQTVILILTVLLSALLFSIIAETSFTIVEESEAVRGAKYGKADIAITADGNADSSYIGSADISSVLGEGDTFSGYMILPAYDDSGTALGAVTDFETIGEIFDFSFIEYGTVTSENVNKTVFVTKSFAKEHSLEVGDSYTVNVLGVSAEYIVRGINSQNFFGEYSFIINARGALDIVSGLSPVFAVFDGDNIPLSKVYVRTDCDVAQKIQSINQALNGDNWSADYAEGAAKEYVDSVTTVLIPVIVLFTAVIAGVLVYFSLNIISERRKNETANFILAGISPVKAVLAFIIETSVYVALGTLAGLAVSAIVLPIMGGGKFAYTTLTLKLRGFLICIAAEALVEAVATIIYFLRNKRKKTVKNKRVYAVIIASLIAIIACFILSAFVKVERLYILSLVAFIGVIALIFACISPLCRGCAKAVAPRAEKSGKSGGVWLSLALKNGANTYEIHNVMRVLSVILSVIFVAIVTLTYTSSLMQSYTSMFNCDYVVINAYGDVARTVGDTEGTQDYCVCGIYVGQFDNGENFYVADISDSGFLNIPSYQAEGNGIYMPKTSADLFGIAVGDEFVLEISGVECTLVLSGYSSNSTILGFFDADYFGFSKNIILVQGEGDGYLTRLSQRVSVYGAFVQSPDSLFSMQINSIKNIVDILNIYLCFMCIIAAVGAVNLVGVSYVKRKPQFNAFIMVGMTRGDVAKTITFEALVILIFTLVISAACGFTLCYFLNNGMRSFGFSLL